MREVPQHVCIELLVVDVNLLGISGLERLTLLRRDQSCDKPPVILPSAVPDQPEIGKEIRGTVPSCSAHDRTRLIAGLASYSRTSLTPG